MSTIKVLPASDLPQNADVTVFVSEDQKRYIRWMFGDENDKLQPAEVYNPPGWVWSLYQQGIIRGREEALASSVKDPVKPD